MYSVSGSDTVYVVEAREISANVQRLTALSSGLSKAIGSDYGDAQLSTKLREAKSLAVATHQQLQRFWQHVQETCGNNPAERSQRRQTYRQLDARFQAALRVLDRAAQQALRGGPSTESTKSTVVPSHSDLSPAGARHSRLSEDDTLSLGSAAASDEDSRAGGAFWNPRPSKRSKRRFMVSNERRQPPLQQLVYPSTLNAGSGREVALVELPPIRRDVAVHTVLELEKDVRGIRSLYDAVAAKVNDGADDLGLLEAQLRSVADIQLGTTEQLRQTASIPGFLRANPGVRATLLVGGAMLGVLILYALIVHLIF